MRVRTLTFLPCMGLSISISRRLRKENKIKVNRGLRIYITIYICNTIESIKDSHITLGRPFVRLDKLLKVGLVHVVCNMVTEGCNLIGVVLNLLLQYE